jgi:DNA repair protein RecO (recombination protein O)
MRDQRSIGIILRIYPFTETSLILHWLTADYGRVATIAKGARRPKSPFRGKLDLFFKADITWLRSRSSDLHTLSEISVLENREALRHDLVYLEQAAYCAALLEQTTETDTPLPEMFSLLDSFLNFVPQQAPQPQSVFAFEVKLLDELGLAPDLSRKPLSPGAEQILQKLAKSDWPTIGRLRLSETQSTELRQFLHGFLIYHLGKIPEGHNKALGQGS